MFKGTAFAFIAVKKIYQLDGPMVAGVAVIPFEFCADRFTADLLPRHLFDLLNIAVL